jgi:autotransporter-associated beta strand protein
LSVTKTAFVAGQLDVKLIDGFTPTTAQTFDILTAGQSLDGEFSNMTNGHVMLPDGISAFAVNVDTTSKVVRLSNYGLNEWQGTAGNVWSDMAAWTAMEPNGTEYIARFGTVAVSAGLVTLDAARTVKAIQLANTNRYTISGTEPLTLDNGDLAASIDVTAGSHILAAPLVLDSDLIIDVVNATDKLTISQPITGAGQSLTKNGDGVLEISGAIDYTGNTIVNGGTLTVTTLNIPSASVAIGNGATFKAGSLVCDTLIIGNSATVAAVPEPSSLMLFCCGLAGVLCWGIRSKNAITD